jgi:DNA-binding response OmpR family regulator
VSQTRARKLLLVEDEGILRGLIAQFLRSDGFEVVEAADGGEAVEAYAARRPFDVVLLDLNLPVFCGVEVCRRIKMLDPLQPVLICSAAILDSDVEILRTLDVHRYLTKPYHPLELLAGIAALTAATPESGSVRVDRSHGSAAGSYRGGGRSVPQLNSGPPESQTLAK